ncbi:hypothetical protein [Streptosporangium sp. NPDC006007]|uniref:hypothetical protein n=1 Tax=Streptosporangium sp. NPDC006007 TaxID=3154575 RepID=UPI0033A07454
MILMKLNLFYLMLPEKEQERLARRHDRLGVMEQYIDGAVTKLQALGRPRKVRVRSRFVHQPQPAPGEVSDRRLPPPRDRPPSTRVLSPRGIALRFYLIALCAAQMRTKVGRRPRNDLPLIAGGNETGWIDLIAVPVEAQHSGRFSASRSSKKQRQVISALRSLSDPSVQLVHLPNASKRSGKYEGFQLCDEGGSRSDGEVPDYVVPTMTDRYFDLPVGLFTNGWIHLLEDTELAFLMMIAHASLHIDPGGWVKIESGLRLLHYGLGRDAYEAHKTLQAFGLLGVHIDEDRHDDGKVINYGQGGQPRLHAFRLLPDGFDEPAAATIKEAITFS